jgi:hypothetical protein
VDQPDWLAGQFEAHRTHLRAAAYRMLGSPIEADDAVQEAWLRAVAGNFARRGAKGARMALINGIPRAVWAPGGTPRVIFGFTFVEGKITAIHTLADPAVIGQLDVAILSG